MKAIVTALIVAHVVGPFSASLSGGAECSAAIPEASQDGPSRISQWAASPDWYRKEALRLLLGEANAVARNLNLPERLPIVEGDLEMAFIPPPGIARGLSSLGVIETRHYMYSVPSGNKLCFVDRKHQDELLHRLIREYSWPIKQADTNAAYQLAEHWLAAFPVDVARLNRDYKVEIALGGLKGHGSKKRFTPVYWVGWPARPKGSGCVAEVCLFLPSKTLIGFSVFDPKYVLRNPVTVTNPPPPENQGLKGESGQKAKGPNG